MYSNIVFEDCYHREKRNAISFVSRKQKYGGEIVKFTTIWVGINLVVISLCPCYPILFHKVFLFQWDVEKYQVSFETSYVTLVECILCTSNLNKNYLMGEHIDRQDEVNIDYKWPATCHLWLDMYSTYRLLIILLNLITW